LRNQPETEIFHTGEQTVQRTRHPYIEYLVVTGFLVSISEQFCHCHCPQWIKIPRSLIVNIADPVFSIVPSVSSVPSPAARLSSSSHHRLDKASVSCFLSPARQSEHPSNGIPLWNSRTLRILQLATNACLCAPVSTLASISVYWCAFVTDTYLSQDRSLSNTKTAEDKPRQIKFRQCQAISAITPQHILYKARSYCFTSTLYTKNSSLAAPSALWSSAPQHLHNQHTA
jgi:hypothetical protein